jgi:hypothetical protein
MKFAEEQIIMAALGEEWLKLNNLLNDLFPNERRKLAEACQSIIEACQVKNKGKE